MGGIKLPNAPHTVGRFINANAIMGKETLYQFLYAHINVCCTLCACACVHVCEWEVVTLLQTVQIYLYANWTLVKRAGAPHGLSLLVKPSWS